MVLYVIDGVVLGGACIDLSAIPRLSRMRHPHRSREARAVFRQIDEEKVNAFQLRFGIRREA